MHASNPGKSHIGWFDVHVPHQANLKGALDFAADNRPDHFILGGDFLNLEWASHWNQAAFADIGRVRLREMLFEEMDAGIKVIKDIKRAIGSRPKIWFIPGNHESWLSYAVYYHQFVASPFKSTDFCFRADMAKMLDANVGKLLSALLDAKKLGITVLPYREPLKIGKLIYLHGDQFTGREPTQNSAAKWPCSHLIYGHHHVHSVKSLFNNGDPSKYYQHVAVPSMCQLKPGYLKDKSHRWMNGFWYCRFEKDLFDGRVVKMFNGRVIR